MLDAITLEQLYVFLCVVEEGTFSGAARKLLKAQSAVSYAIGNLERLLHVKLFERSGKRPQLTKEGQVLLGDVRMIFAQVNQLKLRANRISEGLEASVGLAIDMLFPMPDLVKCLQAFKATFPTVLLQVYNEALGSVSQLVSVGKCQIGVSTIMTKFPSNLEVRTLGKIAMVTTSSPTHALAQLPSPISSFELKKYTQLVVTDRSTLTEGENRGVLSEYAWKLADLNTKYAFLLAGFGWGHMPLHMVKDDVEKGTLVKLTLENQPSDMELELLTVFRSDAPPGPAGQWLMKQLQVCCQ